MNSSVYCGIVPNLADTRTLLLIDSDRSHVDVFRDAIAHAPDGPFTGEWARTIAEGIERSSRSDIWAIFVNLSLPDSHGLDTVDRLVRAVHGTPIVVVGGTRDEYIALETLHHGAKDYLGENHLDTFTIVRAIRNLVERKNVEDALHAEKERAEVTLNSIGDAVLSTDIEGKVTYLNAVAEKMTGWTRDEAVDKPISEVLEIVDGNTGEVRSNPLEAAIEKDETVELSPNSVLISRDRNECPIEDSAAPIHDRNGEVAGAVIVFRDVSRARALGQEMSHLAQHDNLTNLPNRMLLKDRMTQAIAASQRNSNLLAVLYIDLDGFKHINDSLGHEIGDKLLQSVASRLQGSVRHIDTVSRLGGDEFVVLLSEIAHAHDAGDKARKILNALLVPHEIDGYSIRLTASIGVTICPSDGRDAETLIRNADRAMYQAKGKGRNNYKFFEEDMNARAMQRHLVEGSLRYALERNEFFLHYQPKINLITGAITGVESLIRWQHPDRGLIGPPQFISIAEDSGLMVPIGRWVLRESCRQAQAWQDAGLRPIGLAVNVSAVEFRNDDFLDGVRNILRETRLEPHYLELELTESVLMQHAEFTAPVLRELKEMGVRLAIDDFGTGYSSLSYLRQFPIDTLKVDQSFVHEIDGDTNSDDSTIIRAMIDMGRSLKHRVVAEGIETAAHLKFLQVHGCEEGQGFYFSRPVSASQCAGLLQNGVAVVIQNQGNIFRAVGLD